MRSMKSQGLVCVRELLARVRKLHAMDRIQRRDKEFIERRLQEIQARIIGMRETDEFGKEV